ncbi:MAG: hypothetical protein RLZZ383_2200 [Pseudomonadota bacterium]|jgi:hypothetical protein
MSEHDDAGWQRRGTLGLLTLAVPISSIVLVGGLWVGMAVMGNAGRDADGPAVTLDVTACADALPIVRDRAEAMGLDVSGWAPTPHGATLPTRLPAAERSQRLIAATLAAPGRLVVRDAEGHDPIATEADLAEATAYLPFLDAPKVQAVLAPDAAKRLKAHMQGDPEGSLAFVLDDVVVTTRRNMPPEEHGELTLDRIDAEDDFARMDFAAFAGIVLSHGPLPCPVTLTPAW